MPLSPSIVCKAPHGVKLAYGIFRVTYMSTFIRCFSPSGRCSAIDQMVLCSSARWLSFVFCANLGISLLHLQFKLRTVR